MTLTKEDSEISALKPHHHKIGRNYYPIQTPRIAITTQISRQSPPLRYRIHHILKWLRSSSLHTFSTSAQQSRTTSPSKCGSTSRPKTTRTLTLPATSRQKSRLCRKSSSSQMHSTTSLQRINPNQIQQHQSQHIPKWSSPPSPTCPFNKCETIQHDAIPSKWDPHIVSATTGPTPSSTHNSVASNPVPGKHHHSAKATTNQSSLTNHLNQVDNTLILAS